MKIKYLYPLILFIVFFILYSIFNPLPKKDLSPPQTEIRAALDIGSGATNLKIAEVDPQSGKILKQLFEESVRVPYQKQLEQSKDNRFDEKTMEEGIESITLLKNKAENYPVKKIVAVATAAFRQAENAQAFAKEIEAKTGVQVRIIDQDEEGILAFRGALALTSVLPEKAVVWDIGGGSMQLTTLSDQGTYLVEKGKTASVPFKNAFIEKVKHQNLKDVQNPNPMTTEEILGGVALSESIAKETSPFFIEKLKQPDSKVVAVGNLFNYGIKPLVGSPVFKPSALSEAVMRLEGQTFGTITESSLAEVAGTNPILVLGFMRELSIPEVEIVNVNNTDGALTYPAYWTEIPA